jgi:hypothetical protein
MSKPTAKRIVGIIASTSTHGWVERNGGARVAEPAATCPARSAVAARIAIAPTTPSARKAGKRQFGGSPSR